MSALKLRGLGGALPEKVLTNDDLSRMVETSDEWITSRTGIKERRICRDETQYSLALEASRKALRDSGIDPGEISLCLTATTTPSYIMPSTSALLQRDLGLPESVMAFDLNAACTGFIYAMKTASALLSSENGGRYALVAGAEQFSRILDFTDRSTCILFGDGAGAAVFEKDPSRPFISRFLVRGDSSPLFCGGVNTAESRTVMDGPAVFRFAVESVTEILKGLEEESGLPLSDADGIICHQANRRIIESAARHLKLPAGKFFMDLEFLGNTSAASIPLALFDMKQQGLLKEHGKYFLAGFGAGLTAGGVYLEL